MNKREVGEDENALNKCKDPKERGRGTCMAAERVSSGSVPDQPRERRRTTSSPGA